MANDDTKNLEKIIKEAIRPLKDMVEVVKHKIGRMESGKEAQSTSLYLMREQQSVMNEKLDKVVNKVDALSKDVEALKKDVKEVQENVDAARGDIESMHMDIIAIKETEGLFHSRNKREIDEIKTHLNLPLIPDTPAI